MGSTIISNGPFSFTSNTGNNMVILIQRSIAPTINGKALAAGDVIGAFTPSGLCVGSRVWPDSGNITITVWGDDDQTPEKDGAASGDSLSFRVWDSATAQVGNATVTWLPAVGGVFNRMYTYGPNALSGLASLEAKTIPVVPADSVSVQSDSGSTTKK
jgi:hypothetical protein